MSIDVLLLSVSIGLAFSRKYARCPVSIDVLYIERASVSQH